MLHLSVFIGLLAAFSSATQCEFEDASVCTACVLGSEVDCIGAVEVYCGANAALPICQGFVVGCPFQATRDGPESPCGVEACTDSGLDADCEAAVHDYCSYELLTARTDPEYAMDVTCADFRPIGCTAAGQIKDCNDACVESSLVGDGVCLESLNCVELNYDGFDCETPTPTETTTPTPGEPTSTTAPTDGTTPTPQATPEGSTLVGELSLTGVSGNQFDEAAQQAFKVGVANSCSRSGTVILPSQVRITNIDILAKQDKQVKQDEGSSCSLCRVVVAFEIDVIAEEADSVIANLQNTEQLKDDLNEAFEAEGTDVVVGSVDLASVGVQGQGEEEEEEGSGNNGGMIAGVVIACLVVVGLIGLAGFLYNRRQDDEEGRKKKETKPAPTLESKDTIPIATMVDATPVSPKKKVGSDAAEKDAEGERLL